MTEFSVCTLEPFLEPILTVPMQSEVCQMIGGEDAGGAWGLALAPPFSISDGQKSKLRKRVFQYPSHPSKVIKSPL